MSHAAPTYWFMSYAFTRGRGPVCFGSHVTDQHPLAVVTRWNKREAPNQIALLSFRPLTDEEAALAGGPGEFDFEITPD